MQTTYKMLNQNPAQDCYTRNLIGMVNSNPAFLDFTSEAIPARIRSLR